MTLGEAIVVSLLSGLFGALLAIVAGLLVIVFERAARVTGNWKAIFVEVQECGSLARTFRADNVMAPLYRLSAVTFRTSYPALLSDAAIDENRATALLRFYSEVETLNRGLDLAEENSGVARDTQLPIYARNMDKAENIEAPSGGLYAEAIALCEAHRAKPNWRTIVRTRGRCI